MTLFNRGKSNPGLEGRPIEEIQGDRNVAEDIKKLAGRKWDAVIDTSGYFPKQVRSAMGVLSGKVRQYVFISSIPPTRANEARDGRVGRRRSPRSRDGCGRH